MTTWEEVSKERDQWEDNAREVVLQYVKLLQIVKDEFGEDAHERILTRLYNDRK